VSPLAIRRLIHRFRRHGAVLLAVIAVGCAVAVHHSVLSMGEMHSDPGMSTPMELCLGVVLAVGAVVAAVAVAALVLGRWRSPMDLGAVGLSLAPARPEARARASPALLSLLCISRR
jgi:sorbitol-specific phosphotransferase system component IIBC